MLISILFSSFFGSANAIANAIFIKSFCLILCANGILQNLLFFPRWNEGHPHPPSESSPWRPPPHLTEQESHPTNAHACIHLHTLASSFLTRCKPSSRRRSSHAPAERWMTDILGPVDIVSRREWGRLSLFRRRLSRLFIRRSSSTSSTHFSVSHRHP